MIPVVRMKLPDIEDGSIQLTDAIDYKRIFVLSENLIYGPFTITTIADHKLIAEPYYLGTGLPDNHVLHVGRDVMENDGVFLFLPPHCQSMDIAPHVSIVGFVTSLREVRELYSEDGSLHKDYMSDHGILRLVLSSRSKATKRELMSKKAIRELTDSIKQLGSTTSTLAKARFERAIKILETAESAIDMVAQEGDHLIQTILKTPFAETLIKREAEKNKTTSVESINKDVPVISKEQSERQTEEIKNHQIRLDKLKSLAQEEARRIDELKQKYSELKEQSESDLKNHVSAAITQLSEEKNSIEMKTFELNEKYQLLLTKHTLADKIDVLEGILGSKYSSKANLERQIEELSSRLKTNLEVNLGEHFTLTKLLRDGTINDTAEEVFEYKRPIYAEKEPELASDLVHFINNRFKESFGKELTDVEMGNILVCTEQSMITFLQGKPGSGKTSTAIRLAMALGYLEEHEDSSDNFLNVPVGRGWTSTRDFIGFYNSLKDRFQPARTGVYDFLMKAHINNNDSCNAFRIILLDEANLSPIEHYWSDFISMCDPLGEGRSLSLWQGKNKRQIKPHNGARLRFIATLNNDETTEPLSPRMIDRSPIISMDSKHNYHNFAGSTEVDFSGAISKELINKCFGVKESSKDIEDYSVIKSIVDICELRKSEYGEIIDISARKKIAIANYLNVFSPMTEELIAQDFAVCQYILPLVKGETAAFKNRLEELRNIAEKNQLIRSENLIRRIIESGDTYLHSYSFI